jgi:hypothetical protein
MVNLSGNWLGIYWQNKIPTRFEIVFVQSGNIFTGNILDENYLGEATVSGEVVGFSLSFTKRYLLTSNTPVIYTGTGIISENENYIYGKWNVGFCYSGLWEARRSDENVQEKIIAKSYYV